MPAIPKFIVLSEQLRGRMFELNQDEITIGRSDDRTITLKDPTVSTLHCKITRNGDKVIRTRGLDADQTEAAIKATLRMLNIYEESQ